MRIVFFGTPDYVLPIVNKLHKEFKPRSGESPIVAVVTQKPKPSGRKGELKYSAVDDWAHKKKVPIYFDPKDFVKEGVQADIGILASYGEIVSKSVISHFNHGILNIHPSLLPKWRGASPVQATIISGDQAGASIIKLDEELDHGPIISQFKEDANDNDTTETLRNRLFERSSDVLTTLIPAYLKGKITPRKQDDKNASFTRQIKKDDAFIEPKFLQAAMHGEIRKKTWIIPFMGDFSINPSATSLHRFVRAMQPWPIAWSYIHLENKKEQKRLKILKAHLRVNSKEKSKKSNVLVLDEVQLEGKNPVSWEQFEQGYPKASF